MTPWRALPRCATGLSLTPIGLSLDDACSTRAPAEDCGEERGCEGSCAPEGCRLAGQAGA
eukprot:152994-Prymnesium_polylepis.1